MLLLYTYGMTKSTPQMTLSEELTWRDQVKDKTFDDLTWLDTPKTFYLGVDCNSSDSMTIGNLAIFLMARRLRKHGWKAVLLVGGATSLIGDPGGKDDERALKPREEVLANVRGIRKQVDLIFSGMSYTPVDNYDWFKDIGYLDFLRDVGKHFSMTELLQRDFISSRIGEGGSGISYAEFSYSMIQGYDYWQLFKDHGAVLQIGGSDQWGNMLSGVPLIRKKENEEVHALSMPLVINKSTGKKFGKSEDGAIWLDGAKTSPYKFYQFWLNLDDDGVEDYLKIYTEITPDELSELMKRFNEDRSIRLAQKTLAYEVTTLIHGEDAAESVKRVSKVLFGGADYMQLSADDFKVVIGELGSIKAEVGSNLVDVLVDAKLASSKGEARRFISSKAVYINGKQIDESKQLLEASDTIQGYVVLRRGKNSQIVVEV